MALTFGRLAGQNAADMDAAATPFDAKAWGKAASGAYKDGACVGTGDGFKGPVKVDAVSGATYSSCSIIEAVDNALAKAKYSTGRRALEPAHACQAPTQQEWIEANMTASLNLHFGSAGIATRGIDSARGEEQLVFDMY